MIALINQPSTLLSNGYAAIDSEEPTVLFTSKQFENFGSTINRKEENEFGLLIKHGNNLTQASPPTQLISSSMRVEYFGLARRLHSTVVS